MKTSHPRAKQIAREMGVRICYLNAERTEHEIDCTAEEFAEMLAEFESDGTPMPDAKFDHAAYARLQNEGNREPRGSTDPEDEFSAGRE